MRTKKLIEKMMIGMLLGSGCLLSSCHSVYMSAEDRLQGDYQEAAAEVELETVEELTAFAYSDVSVIPYTVENIARGFTDLSDEEIEKYFTGSLPWILSYSSLTSEPGRASVGEAVYHVVFFTICSLAAAKCVKAVMQKRFLNGMD